MGVALHKPADNNGLGFVHTYGLINGRGYHMSTDSNLCKWAWIRAYLHTEEWAWPPYVYRQWAWLTKEAGLHYDM